MPRRAQPLAFPGNPQANKEAIAWVFAQALLGDPNAYRAIVRVMRPSSPPLG